MIHPALVTAALVLSAAPPAAAARPAPPHPPSRTVYGDVIVEVQSPKDPHTGMPGVR